MKITIDSIKKTILLAGGLFLSVLSVNADDIQKAIDHNYLRTPEAAAFKKYGEESVNEYTGTADISVPLYTIKCKDIEIPLVLRYDASGIKVEQEASWVGLGWNLMVGGCINYVCAGGHDMYGAPHVENKVWTEYLTSEFGDWHHADSTVVEKNDGLNNIFNADTICKTFNWEYRHRTMYYTYDPKDKFNWMGKIPLHTPCVDSYLDVFLGDESGHGMKEYIECGYGERDFYSVNVMGKSFMFFIDPATLEIFHIGKAGEEFKVIPTHSSPYWGTGIDKQSDIENWTIKDSDGYVYEFNKGDKYQRDNSSAQPYTSCWYLTKIQSPTGETVELQYESFSKPGRSTLVESVNLPFSHGACCSDAADQLRTSSGASKQSENAGMHVTSHYLSNIKTQNQTVTFATSESDECSGKRLDAIKVVYSDGNTIKDIKFSYSSFVPSNIGGNYASDDPSIKSQKRLKLDNVKEIASGEALTTSFSYNELQLPSKRSYAQDYWGYYNGRENKVKDKHTLLPTPRRFMSSYYNKDLERYTEIGGADRLSYGSFMKAAILNKVVYPTGGYTKYEYEANTILTTDSSLMDYDEYVYASFSWDNRNGATQNFQEITFELPEDTKFDIFTRCQAPQANLLNNKKMKITLMKWLSDGKKSESNFEVWCKCSEDHGFTLINSEGLKRFQNLSAGKYTLIIIPPDVHVPSNSNPNETYGWSVACQLKGWHISKLSSKGCPLEVGGLRVRRISNYDNNDKPINYTEYEYSGGVLLNRIETIDFVQKLYNAGTPPSGYKYRVEHKINLYTITTGHPHMPAFFTSCIPGIVGYDRVKKSKYDANGNLEKSVITSYKNNSPQSNNTYGIEYLTTFDNGLAYKQEIYNASGGIVAKTENTYFNDSIAHYATNMIVKSKTISSIKEGGNGTCALSYELRERHDKTGSITREIDTLEVLPFAYQILRYPYFLSRSNLEKTTTTEYSKDGKTIVRTKEYSYNPRNHQVSQIKENTSLPNQDKLTKYTYSVDDTNEALCRLMRNSHILNSVVETKNILMEDSVEKCLSTQHTIYGGPGYQPSSLSTSIGNNALETRATYSYDDLLNVRSISLDGMETVYLWSYKGQYPVAKIEGLTYAEVENAVTKSVISNLLRSATPKTATINSIRSKIKAKGGLITTYTYKPLVGITSETKPNGLKTTYEYDGFGRLVKVLDHNNKVVSTNSYNYKK